MASLTELKQSLAEAQKRQEKLGRSVERAQKWKDATPFAFIKKRMDSLIEKARHEREDNAARIDRLKKAIANYQQNVPPMVDGGWHPGAERRPYPSSGGFTVGKKKVVLHTTEGSSLPSYSGSNPHFTLDPKTGHIWQHVSIASSSSALVNAAGGVETNHAGAIQIEMIGFASQTPNWTDAQYANVKALVDWIRKHAGIGTAHPSFSTTPHRMSGSDWINFNGVCGHQHVPENEHWDPGAFKVEKVL